jgi:hypothetical protein
MTPAITPAKKADMADKALVARPTRSVSCHHSFQAIMQPPRHKQVKQI